jgi:hypothetical protein
VQAERLEPRAVLAPVVFTGSDYVQGFGTLGASLTA